MAQSRDQSRVKCVLLSRIGSRTSRGERTRSDDYKSSGLRLIIDTFFLFSRRSAPDSIATNHFPFLRPSTALLAQWVSLCCRMHTASLPCRSNAKRRLN